MNLKEKQKQNVRIQVKILDKAEKWTDSKGEAVASESKKKHEIPN